MFRSNRQSRIKTTVWIVPLLLSVLGTSLVVADDKPTSLTDARAAAEANLRAPEGKAYDEKLGKELTQKYVGTLRQCKQTAGKDLESFWMLLKLAKDGTVKEVLLHPQTKVGSCARESFIKDRFSPPPRPAYWVGVYLKMAH